MRRGTNSQMGHLFQGRFKAILVDKDSHLPELARYVVLNPVRAGMVREPQEWKWSSHRAMAGDVAPPPWLAADALLAHFGKRRAEARRRYRQFVAEGIGRESVWKNLRQQIYLGDEKFVERMQQQARMQGDELSIPLAQRRAPVPPLATIAVNHANRDDAIVAAYATGACG